MTGSDFPPARTFSCSECGFDASSMSEADLVAACTAFARKFKPPLTRFLPGEHGDAVVRHRPAPGVWSPLEYVAHTRDVLAFYRDRITRVLEEERPTLSAAGFGSRDEEARYHDEDRVAVAEGVAAEATALADLLGGLGDGGWARVGLSSDGSGAERSVRVLAERAVHDAHHHLLDVGRGLRAARSD